MKRPGQWKLTPRELATGLYKEIGRDEVTSLAAQMGYYFLFSMFPMMVFLIALLGFLPIQDLTRQMLAELRAIAPQDVYQLVEGHILNVVMVERPGLLSGSAIVALYSASAGVSSTMVALNRAYGVSDSRPFLKDKAIALALTVAVSGLIILATAVIVGGESIAVYLSSNFGRLGTYYAMGWRVLQWLIAPSAILLSLSLLYYYGPDVKQEWKWITPGSMIATVLWLAATVGFSYYVTNFGNFNAAYGSLGGVMVTMLWLYISSLVILIGGEINALLEHANVEGKDKGERAPGVSSAPEARPEVTGRSADSVAVQALQDRTPGRSSARGGAMSRFLRTRRSSSDQGSEAIAAGASSSTASQPSEDLPRDPGDGARRLHSAVKRLQRRPRLDEGTPG